MQGQHTHNWIYNEAKEWIVNNMPQWRVVRFCPDCKELEIIELKPLS